MINENAPLVDGSGKSNGHFLTMQSRIINSWSGVAEIAINYHLPKFYLKESYKTCTIQFDYYIMTMESYYLYLGVGLEDFEIFYIVWREAVGGWRQARANIGTNLQPFMIEFRGFLKDLKQSVLAIDNINLVDCAVPKPLLKNQTCSEDKILCNSTRICIDKDDVCDGQNDCFNWSDEIDCVEKNICTFDYIWECQLEFVNENDSKANWRVAAGISFFDVDKIGYEPLVDNTL